MFSDFTKFAAASYALAAECDCEAGCPRCLHSTACPQHNKALHDDHRRHPLLYCLPLIFLNRARTCR
ncbi:hypothetical protein [Nostoc sp.]|uniref:hypothetical protein n=1 Tax=Nostoc sp. TaxID=1180 RepID=UPI002FF4F246